MWLFALHCEKVDVSLLQELSFSCRAEIFLAVLELWAHDSLPNVQSLTCFPYREWNQGSLPAISLLFLLPSANFIWFLRMANRPSVSSWQMDFWRNNILPGKISQRFFLWLRPFSAFLSTWQCTRMWICKVGSWPLSPVPEKKAPPSCAAHHTNKHKVSLLSGWSWGRAYYRRLSDTTSSLWGVSSAAILEGRSTLLTPLNILEAFGNKRHLTAISPCILFCYFWFSIPLKWFN